MEPKVVAIIPARGGSKTIPRKNIKLLNGKPLIAYAIEVAKKSSGISRVIVSSDDEEIISIAKKYGAEVPYKRPEDLAQDSTPDRHVLQHAIRWLMDNEKFFPDFVLNLKCTTPLKESQDIDRLVEKWLTLKCDSVRSVTKVNGVHHPYWMFLPDDDGMAKPLIEDISIDKYYQRQLLPCVYRLNGVADGARADIILNHKNYWGEKMALIEIPEERSIDIDTLDDFEFAEYMMKKQKSE